MTNLPILPTAIVGSYAMPGWLERLKTEYFARRISRHDLDEIHDAAVKAAIKDEEIAGLDIVTDGELRRDNMVDYFVERMPGVQIDRSSKKFYYDFYDSVVQGKLPTASLGLVPDYRFLQRQYGAHAEDLHHRSALPDQADSQSVLPDRRSSRHGSGQSDERGAEGSGEGGGETDSDRRAVLFRISGRSRLGREGSEYAGGGRGCEHRVHICYGNRYGKPIWEGSYRYLFPRILDAKVHQFTLEFARRGGEDLDLFKEFPSHFELGLGVIDVKTHDVETPEMVAEHIRKALEVLPPEKIYVLPDCGCFHLPRDIAFAKIQAMVEGTKIVRKELGN